MRYTICEEGTEAIPDRYIMKGSLICEHDQVTISNNFDFDNPPIGYARDLQRDDEGVWSAEIELFDGREVPDDCGFSVYIAPVRYHMWKDVAWCTAGFIQGVALIQYKFWKEENHEAEEKASAS